MRAAELGLSVEQYLALEPETSWHDRQLVERARDAFPMQISEAEPSHAAD
ncbi:hypothetical protein [Catalinimonas alkaloidigena]|nr:hypothetical protein [Catalinimonas alkaloidigena]